MGSVGSVGSVAEETARLLDALFGSEPPAAEAPPDPPADDEPAQPGDRHTADATTEPAPVCGTCGQSVGAEGSEEGTGQAAAVCHLCPVCQLISAVRAVRPETVDRLADLAAALTQALRDVAATRWAETGTPAAERHRSTVEDIDVTDEEPTGDR